ncbi:hypothetical protein ACHQM5_010864 [Ranunculus cassubicifolius]
MASNIKPILIVLFVITLISFCVARDTLYTNERLEYAQQLNNGRFSLSMESSCNLVLRDGATVVWTTNTAGRGNRCHLIMQSDGNLVIYQESPRVAIWATGQKANRNDYTMVLQNDRNVVVYAGFTSARLVIWASGTYLRSAATTMNTTSLAP